MPTRPKTMQEAFNDLGEAWRAFVLEFAYSLRIDKLCAWLSRKLERR